MFSNIYKITNTLTQEKYIGRTINDINTRYLQHLKNPQHTKLTQAFEQYGESAFEVGLLATVLRPEEANVESYFIAKYLSYFKGYNSNSGVCYTRGTCQTPIDEVWDYANKFLSFDLKKK